MVPEVKFKKREIMKKSELIAKLEGAKELTSVVSIDLVLAGLNMLEPEVKVETVVGLNAKSFNEVMDAVGAACRNLRSSRAVDFDSAQFAINYNNQVELEEVDLDTDFIEDVIREELENLLIEEDEDEVAETGPGSFLQGSEGEERGAFQN